MIIHEVACPFIMADNTTILDFDNGILCFHGVRIDAHTRWKDIEALPEDMISILSSGWCWGSAAFTEPVKVHGHELDVQILYQNGHLEARLTPVDDEEDIVLLYKIDDCYERAAWREWQEYTDAYEKKKYETCVFLMRKITTNELFDNIAGTIFCSSSTGLHMQASDGSYAKTSSRAVTGSLRFTFLPVGQPH